MRILITNDDGINAKGLIPFVNWAKKLGEVVVIAPKYEQSAKSHSIDIHNPFEIKKVDLVEGVLAYEVNSSPADCVRVALLGFKMKFDLVFSGINRGYNVGADIMYSGTVSAAREAAYLGLKAIAVSSDAEFDNSIVYMDYIWNYFKEKNLLQFHNLYNVNIPKEGQEIRFAEQGGPYIVDDFYPIGDDMFKAKGHCAYNGTKDLNIDIDCVRCGHIAISPLSIKQIDYDILNKIKEIQ